MHTEADAARGLNMWAAAPTADSSGVHGLVFPTTTVEVDLLLHASRFLTLTKRNGEVSRP